MLDCVLITDDEALRRHVRNLVQGPDSSDRLVLELTESASDLPRERIADVLAANPRVVFVDLGDSVMGLRVLEVLSKEAPEVTLIAAGPDLAADSLLRVIRAGASEYLPRPFAPDDLSQAFTRIRHRLGKTRSDDSITRGQITTLFSSKGGRDYRSRESRRPHAGDDREEHHPAGYGAHAGHRGAHHRAAAPILVPGRDPELPPGGRGALSVLPGGT